MNGQNVDGIEAGFVAVIAHQFARGTATLRPVINLKDAFGKRFSTDATDDHRFGSARRCLAT